MNDERKKALWPSILALMIGLPVLYLLSLGPACWVSSRLNAGAEFVPTIYHPITLALSPAGAFSPDGGGRLDGAILWYATLGADEFWNWFYLVHRDGRIGWEWTHPQI